MHLLASFRTLDRDAYYPSNTPGGVRIGGIGLVNFDSARVDEICDSLGSGVVLTNQVQVGGLDRTTWKESFLLTSGLCNYQTFFLQFSLIDIRPLFGMADVCKRHGVKLLTYGTLVS